MVSSCGRSASSTFSRSTRTEVSMMPRERRSATRKSLLRGNGVEILSEASILDSWRAAEDGHGTGCGHEAMPVQRRELSYRAAIARDDVALTLVKSPHDLSAVIAELALTDLLHRQSVARRATLWASSRFRRSAFLSPPLPECGVPAHHDREETRYEASQGPTQTAAGRDERPQRTEACGRAGVPRLAVDARKPVAVCLLH